MTHDQITDAELMRDVAEGRTDSLEHLVRRHGVEVLTFIQRIVADSSRRDDIFQDVFLAVWQKRGQYRYPLSVKPWLLKITVNKCREHIRASRRNAWSLEEREVLAIDPPDASLISQETNDTIAASIADLPENQRMVVSLRIWSGLSYAEIAEVCGRTEGTVRSNMHHALNQLREKLQLRLQ